MYHFKDIVFVLYDGGHNKKEMDLSVLANKLFNWSFLFEVLHKPTLLPSITFK